MFTPSDLSHFLVQRLCQKVSKIFRRRFGSFKFDCFNLFSLMRKSFSNFSAVGKQCEERRSPTSALKIA